MNALLNRLCRKTPQAQPLQAAPRLTAQAETAVLSTGGAGPAPAALPVPALPAEASVCGWFDSSLDLRQGLAVSEVRDADWTVLVLWFGPAALRGPAYLH